jgi:hypothetical protein
MYKTNKEIEKFYQQKCHHRESNVGPLRYKPISFHFANHHHGLALLRTTC